MKGDEELADAIGSRPVYVSDLLDQLLALVVELEEIQQERKSLGGPIDDGSGVWDWLDDFVYQIEEDLG